MDIASASAHLIELALQHAPRILAALLVFAIGKAVSSRIGGVVEKLLNRAPNSDASLSRFFASLIRYVILFMVVLVALSILGVDTASFGGMVAGLGIAMAFILKDALGDVAAGVMMLMFRPFNVGDEIEVDGLKGVVREISLTAVRMKTRDNVEMIVQNSKAWGGVIRNHSAYPHRRLDMVFGISYDANIDDAIEVLLGVAKADARIFKDPAPWAKVVNLGDSSVDIELRVWCTFNDMRVLKVELSQPVKAAFDAAGIGIPYPHEVKIKQHVKNSKARDRRARLAKIKNT